MNSAADGRSFNVPRGSSDSYRERNNPHAPYGDHVQPSARAYGDAYAGSASAPRARAPHALVEGNSYPPPSSARNGSRQDPSGGPPATDRAHTTGGARPGKPQRICQSCGEPLTGQFVRALESTFHLECFKCRDCDEVVASKFFPVDDENGQGQYPLCETDYFRRLDLLCHKCGGALRGSYVTALDRKYHVDHFTCSVCPTAFGAKDSYYEHDNDVYCHYHYSTRFAQRCNGCQTAILKQFVEIFRNGRNQHWHPECYMIHKYWNVRLAPPGGPEPPRLASLSDASDETREMVRKEEEQMEDKTYRIWSILSAFEETSAACISDMLLHVSNGAYMEGVLVAKRFIQHVEILFAATDALDAAVIANGSPALTYGREAKLLCKRIVSFFTLLTKTQDTGVKKLGVTQELLSLVTGLAHYLKLLIRISLQGALKLEKERKSKQGLDKFLGGLAELESLKDTDTTLDDTSSLAELAEEQSDLCVTCYQPIDDECLKAGPQRFHLKDLQCSNCDRNIGDDLGLNHAVWLPSRKQAFCPNCSTRYEMEQEATPIEHITRLQQYVYLLRVALARLLSVLRSGGILPHTSDDPNLGSYDSQEGHRVQTTHATAPMLSPDQRSKSFAGPSANNPTQSSYSETVGEMKRLRSTRMEKHLSTTMKQARMSRIIPDVTDSGRTNYRVEDEQQDAHDEPQNLGFRQDALNLDDIPRIVAAEQAKEQRPNAYRYGQNKLLPTERQPTFKTGVARDIGRDGGSAAVPPAGYPAERTKKFFSELTELEYFIVRHVAVLQMQPILDGLYNLEELLGLIESRKTTFWNKFFKPGEKPKGGKKKGVFGVNLELLVEKEGVDSEHGLGPGALRVPALVDDAVSAMRQMDMSVEGVFRKNGNIRGLKDLTERIDSKEGYVDLTKESPVQVAALLKKFLREMPDPLLTHKLYDLFMASQKVSDEDRRRRVLHLTCCLLPKIHRDTLEILFSFLNWTASFAQVDEDSGSKMDTHNLATVIAPNILLRDSKSTGMEDSFLAVEAVHMLLEYNDEMCEVPEDIQSVLSDTELFNNMPELTTKKILKRYDDITKQPGRQFGSIKPEAPDMPPVHEDGATPTSTASAIPVTTRIEPSRDQVNAWQKESSVRHVQNGGLSFAGPGPNTNASPQLQHEFVNRSGPYHQPSGSNSSFEHFSAPNRQNPRMQQYGANGPS